LFARRAQKFKVTAKGGQRETRFIEWPVLRTYVILLVLAVAAVLYAFTFNDRHVPIAQGGLALFWSWYNIIVLFILCLVSIEQPRLRRSGRFPMDEPATVFVQGRRAMFRLRDLSITGAHFAGATPAPQGSGVLVRIGGGLLRATVVRATKGGFAVRFENSLRARVVTIRHIYSAMHERAIQRVERAPLIRAIVSRVLR
jgi:PilZ domain